MGGDLCVVWVSFILGCRVWCGCSLVPSPTPSFSSLLSTVKRGGPGTSSHVSDVEGRKG